MKIIVTAAISSLATLGIMLLVNEWPGNQRLPWEPLANGQEAPLVIDCPRAGSVPQFTRIVTVVGFSPVLDGKSFGMHLNMLPPFDPKSMTDPPSVNIDITNADQFPLGCFVRIANKSDIVRQSN